MSGPKRRLGDPVDDEADLLVAKRVTVSSHLDTRQTLRARLRSDVADECSANSALHPTWVNEQVFMLADAPNGQQRREADDLFIYESDPDSALPNRWKI